MTTADDASAEWRERANILEKELKVPIKMILRKEMMKIISDGLMAKMANLLSPAYSTDLGLGWLDV